MHALRTLALIYIFALTHTVEAGGIRNEPDVLQACSAYSQAGIRACLAKKVGESETKLKQAADKAISVLSKWDEDAKYITSAQEKLALSNKAFVKYRETQCVFAAALGGGAIGNALEMRRLVCEYELNFERAAQLGKLTVGLPLR